MIVRVNGNSKEYTDGLTAVDLLASLGLVPERVAVAVNGEIVPRRRLISLQIDHDDVVDIVSAVAGG